jgi:predicted small metal-binding protein
MKTFACGQVVPGCSATFRATSEAELLGQVAEHARVDHGMTSIPSSVLTAVRQNIISEAA